jgi:hypothetical protein
MSEIGLSGIAAGSSGIWVLGESLIPPLRALLGGRVLDARG